MQTLDTRQVLDSGRGNIVYLSTKESDRVMGMNHIGADGQNPHGMNEPRAEPTNSCMARCVPWRRKGGIVTIMNCHFRIFAQQHQGFLPGFMGAYIQPLTELRHGFPYPALPPNHCQRFNVLYHYMDLGQK